MCRRYLLKLLLLVIFILNERLVLNCNVRTKLQPGEILNLQLPKLQSEPNWIFYQWCISIETNVNLTCNKNTLFQSDNCKHVLIQKFRNQERKVLDSDIYCGDDDNFKVHSGVMIVTLDAPFVPVINCYLNAIINDTNGIFNNLSDSMKCNTNNSTEINMSNTTIISSNNVTKEDNQTCRCGWKNHINWTLSSPSILIKKVEGGSEAQVNEYPMMVGIYDVAKHLVTCGGTIISVRHVITAAHCFINYKIDDHQILVGGYDVSEIRETETSKLLAIARIDSHPNFTSDPLSNYDIALLTMASSIEFTDKVGPACLPYRLRGNNLVDGSFVSILGWGLTSYGGLKSDTLQVARVVILNYESCRKIMTNLRSHQICTYSDSKDSCQFDSGGPVLWENPATGRTVVVGIISYGLGCASLVPSVNTRVSSFIDWIELVTLGESLCQME